MSDARIRICLHSFPQIHNINKMQIKPNITQPAALVGDREQLKHQITCKKRNKYQIPVEFLLLQAYGG